MKCEKKTGLIVGILAVLLSPNVVVAADIHAFLWDPSTGIQDLGYEGYGIAYDINNVGVAVGAAFAFGLLEVYDPVDPVACLWDPATGRRDLGSITGYEGPSYARGINSSGKVVGFSEDFSATFTRGFIWNSTAGMQSLEPFSGWDYSIAYAINDSGIVAGESWKGDALQQRRACIWDPASGVIDLDPTGIYDYSYARDINNAGKVIGGFDGGGFVWDFTNGMQSLEALGGEYGKAVPLAINNIGQIVGRTSVGPYWSPYHAYLWDPVEGILDLGTLGEDQWSVATGINDLGQVVGHSYSSADSVRAFIWDEENGMQELNLSLGGNRTLPQAINDSGQIVGYSEVPEPATMTLLVIGGLAMLRRRRS